MSSSSNSYKPTLVAADGERVEASATIGVEELEAKLRVKLALTDWRATIVLVVAPGGLGGEAEAVRERVVSELGIADEEVVRWDAEASDGQLASINRARDELLQDRRLIWLRVGSPADVRRVRRIAPDLTAAVDLFVELEAAGEEQADWERCRRQLCELMVERHSTLDFTGLLPASVDRTELPLDELYQPLVERGLGELPVGELPVVERGLDELPLLRARTVGPPPRALLLLGHPGTGKTTYLRHLAVRYARGADPLELGPLTPLLLSLSDYAWEREQGRVQGLVEFLPRWLEEQGLAGGGEVDEHLGEVLLLLDGLDEVPSPSARRAVLDEVTKLRRAGELGALVVTGRSFLIDELRPRELGLTLASTRPPTGEQRRAFLTSFVRLRTGEEGHASGLIARIEADEDLRALASTPLMLAFMAILDELEGRLPDRRVEIYYRLGEMLVDRWTRARSIGAGAARRERPTRAQALRVLGPLAWWALERGGGAVSEEALLAEIERIEARREAPEEAARRARALLELLRADTALLVPRPDRRWSFVHTSIAEYFAGVEVERDPQRWRALLDDPFRPEWREILLFCAGQLGVIEGRVDSLDALVDAVLTRSRKRGRYDAKYPSLLIGLLSESPGLSRRQIDELVERLLEFMLTSAFSAESMEQAQSEFVLLLLGARGPVRDSLGEGLRRWFGEGAERIRWDRVFPKRAPLDELRSDFASPPSVGMLAIYSLGLFMTLLLPVLAHAVLYDLDLEPTKACWRRQAGERYRFARWLTTLERDDWSRPFEELAEDFETFE